MTPLPPGQQPARKLPVEGETAPAPDGLNLETWRLSVGGEVRFPLSLQWEEFLALPQVDRTYDIHCVTRWSKPACRWRGMLLSELISRVEPLSEARFVRFVSFSERDHDTSLPLDFCRKEEVLFAHTLDGSPLSVGHGFPLRTVVPARYFYKSLKWVKEVSFVREDVPGYWERNGYHNNADFNLEERFVSGNLPPAEVSRLRVSGDLKRFGGRTLVSLDLRGAAFSGKNLDGVVLKNCFFNGADLRGVSLQKANLSNSDFRNADLRGANLSEADVSGAIFAGADLRGCVFRKTLLSATEFFRPGEPEPKVDGMEMEDILPGGLSETQVDFLSKKGVRM